MFRILRLCSRRWLARNAACNQRRFDVLEHRQPGEKGKALKNDAHVGVRLHNRLAVPENLAGRRLGEPGQHAQQGRLTRTRGTQQGHNFPLDDRQVSGRDHLDAIFARLGVVLLYLLGANDRFSHRKTSNKRICGQIILYRELSLGILTGVPQRYPGRQHLTRKRMILHAASAFLYHDIVTCFGRSGVLERRASERLRSSLRSK